MLALFRQFARGVHRQLNCLRSVCRKRTQLIRAFLKIDPLKNLRADQRWSALNGFNLNEQSLNITSGLMYGSDFLD